MYSQVALVLAVVLALASAQLGLGGLGGLGGGLGSGLSYSSGGSLGGGSLGGGSLGGGSSGGHGHEVIYDYYAEPKYQYKYGVEDKHTGDIKEAQEERNGDKVQGSYSLKEADGTIRVVKYTADKHNGFNAIVERLGHAQHPQGHNYH